MRQHASAETMARFRQGDLSRRRASQISAHLAECGRCSALGEDLAGVTTLLASAHPPPMPEHLAARIQTALAAESASRAGSASPAGSASRAVAPPRTVAPAGRKTSGPERSRRPRLPRIGSRIMLGGLAAAAAAVLVAGGIYEIALRGSSASPGHGVAAAPAGGRAARSAGNGLMVPALPTFGPALQYTRAGRRSSITPIATGTDLTPATLTSQVSAEVTKYGKGFEKTGPNAESPSRPGAASSASVPSGLARFANIPVPALRGCVNRIAVGELVLLVDVARYRGTPATVVVTEAAAAGPMQIWVVGTGCSASASDVLTHATATTPN